MKDVKIVRSKIPSIMLADRGKKPNIQELFFGKDDEKISELFKLKILEEVTEVIEAINIGDTEKITEELCDVYQVMKDYCFFKRISFSSVISCTALKALKKGGFISRKNNSSIIDQDEFYVNVWDFTFLE